MPQHSGEITIKDISHVLELLVSHLYGSDPHLTIRELIQNAHDAIVDLPAGVPEIDKRIHLRINLLQPPFYVEIADSGIGMTSEEMQENFGKIGDSEKLSKAFDRPEIIGRFGIGFLSSFIVADHVEVMTRKYGSKGTFLWETRNKSKWTISEVPDVPVHLKHGTIVRLYFRDRYAANYSERIDDLKTVDGIERIIQNYCYLIQYPINVGLPNDPGRRVNAQRPPWADDGEAEQAYKALFSRNAPLFRVRFDEKDTKLGYQARGVIYFTEKLVRLPSVQLYVKRMLVKKEDSRLVPPYGVFVAGIVDCPQLEVDLSRRQVSEYDPVYRWLRRTMLKNFEVAFIKFATSRAEDFIGLWPKVDNSFISYLTEAYHSDHDDDLKQAAESFLVNAGRHLPFYEVDLVGGSQGRPLWRTIQEAADRRKRAIEGQIGANVSASGVPLVDERKRVKVFYATSKQHVEKDILLNQYGEFIDVGRDGSAHGSALKALESLNDRFEDFVLEEVRASRFSEVCDDDRKRWFPATDLVKRSVVFFGKSHEVVAEVFEPKDTPVVITDTNVDPAQLNALREQFAGTNAVGQGGVLAQRLIAFLDQLAARGGALTVHMNAENSVLQNLRDGLDASEVAVRKVAGDGLTAIAWRAVLDYFGWNSTRDMIARDRTYTHNIIENLLETTKKQAALEEELTRRARAYAESNSEIESLRKRIVDPPSRRIDVICGFIDMVDSTRLLINNPHVGPSEVAEAIRAIILELESLIRKMGGAPVSFTGDGLLFFWEKPSVGHQEVRATLRHLEGAVEIASQANAQLRTLLRKMTIDPPKLRVALSAGEVYHGLVGPTVNIIGLPVVEAARMAALKEEYEKAITSLFVSGTAHNRGAEWRLWNAGDFQLCSNFVPKGVGLTLEVYKPK